MTSLSRLLCFSLFLTAAVLAAAPGDTRAQTSDAKPKVTGSIAGKVTLGASPAAGIAVAVYGSDFSNRRAITQATTDSDGRYRLSGLASGTYQVAALAPNYTAVEPSSISGFGPVTGASKNIVLAPAENVDDIDIKLVRGGVITGRVKDPDGKPVVEQRVGLSAVDEKGTPVRTTYVLPISSQMYQTDDRGVYRIYGLPAGRYKVSVGSDPSRGSVYSGTHFYYPQTFFGDVTDAAKATIVELSEGGEAGNIDIQVARPGETYSASGRIIDESGQPIPGIRFTYGPNPKNQPFFSGFVTGVATNARGEFRIEGLEPGRYGVSVSSNFDLEASTVYSDPTFFEVNDGDVSDLEVKATHGLSMSGVVVTDGITNREVLSQLSSMRITAIVNSSTTPQTSNASSSFIAGDGSFSISGLRPGKAGMYLSSVGNPGIRGLTITRVEHEGVDVTRTLELKAGQALTDVRVFLIFGTGTIRGTVKFENGTLPPSARLFIVARREGASANNNANAQPDSRGRFVMPNLPAGTYEVGLSINFPPSPQAPPRRPQQLKQFVTVTDDGEAEVTFTVDLKVGEGGP